MENIPWDWIVVISILVFLFYGAIAIKIEPEQYKESAIPTPFFDFILHIPSWWGLTDSSETFLKFERTDTRYDWIGKFEKKSCDPVLAPEEIIKLEAKRMEINFDEEILITTNDSDVVLEPGLRESLKKSFARMESMATQFKDNRIYMDLVIIKEPNKDYYYLMYSWSSVLNGMVEGPYFEEVLKLLERASHSQGQGDIGLNS